MSLSEDWGIYIKIQPIWDLAEDWGNSFLYIKIQPIWDLAEDWGKCFLFIKIHILRFNQYET